MAQSSYFAGLNKVAMHWVPANRNFHFVIAVLGLLVISVSNQAQPLSSPPLRLEPGRSVSSSLKGGQSHTYQIATPARSMVRVVVQQRGVDVYVRAFDRNRRRLAHANDSFGRVGPQVLDFLSDAEGEYVIQVFALPSEIGGDYEIRYADSRPATNHDRIRINANGLIAAANELRAKALAETNRQALLKYEQAFALYKQIKDAAGQATSIQYRARIYEAQSDYQRALESYSTALELWRIAADPRGEAYALKGIGGMHVYLGSLDIALPYFHRVIELQRRNGNKEGEALGNHELGNIHLQKGDVSRSLDYYTKALSLYQEVGTKSILAYLLSNMGAAYRDIGDLKRAIDYQHQALDIWRASRQKHGEATGLIVLASIYTQQGELRRAVALYEQAIPLCVAGGEQDCEARAYAQMAAVYDQLGEIQTAVDCYARASRIYRRRGQLVGLLRMLNSAGALYSALGEKERAREYHNEALALAGKSQSRLDEAGTLSYLAEIAADAGEIAEARRLYLRALAITRAIGNRQGEAANLNRLGLLAQTSGQTSEAVSLLKQSLALQEQLGIVRGVALALNNLGVISDRTGNPAAAIDYFNRALRMFRGLEDKSNEAMMLYRLAAAQKQLGHIEPALENTSAAVKIVETMRGNLASLDLRASYFSTAHYYYDLQIELLMRQHQLRPAAGFNLRALQLSEQARARSLLDLLKESNARVSQDTDPALVARERELRELINGKAVQHERSLNDPRQTSLAKLLGQELNSLTLEYESLWAKIRDSNPRYAALTQVNLPLREIQNGLDSQTALLEYKLGDEHSYLWAISKDEVESFELPSRQVLERQARAIYEALTERNRSIRDETTVQRRLRIARADQALEELLLPFGTLVLGPAIDRRKYERVVIIPDGALQYIPFSALFAVEHLPTAGAQTLPNEIISLPSIAVLAHLRPARRSQPERSVAIFADPVFEADDPRLPRRTGNRPHAAVLNQPAADLNSNGPDLTRLLASREEAQAILGLASRESALLAIDFAASIERVKNSDLEQYRVLHFATHALVNTSRPQLSGVVLSLYDSNGRPRDGFLRLSDIYQLRLSNDLVVLSACSTALGRDVRGEGLMGLTRGFMHAGAPQVVASFWKVDDEATAEFMKKFYGNLFSRGMTAPAALSDAQQQMRQQARWRSPYYWAAFTLQGDWR